MRDNILQMMNKYASQEGVTETGLEGFQLFRITEPVERIPAVYYPAICGILQGSKRAYLHGEEMIYDAEGYLCCTMPIPIEAEVPFATPDEPVLGFLLSLDSRILTELLFEMERTPDARIEPFKKNQEPGIKVLPWDEPFTTAIMGLFNLLEDSLARKLLGEGRMREVMFSLLKGEAGPLLLESIGASRDLFRVLSYIREHLNETITIEGLVKQAGMSKAVLHRKFKAATTLSPLQYIKALRLNEAAMMLAKGSNVSQTAYEVGYESASQFSREFRRHFGKPPREWARSTSEARMSAA